MLLTIVFERLGDELHRVLGLQTVGAHVDVDHRHGDLRLLLARQRDSATSQRQKPQGGRAGQRRADEARVSRPRQPQVHGCTRTSPAFTPERISTPSPTSGTDMGCPRCTGTSTGPATPSIIAKSIPYRVVTKAAGTTKVSRAPGNPDPYAFADEVVAQPGDGGVGHHPAILDLRIDEGDPAERRGLLASPCGQSASDPRLQKAGVALGDPEAQHVILLGDLRDGLARTTTVPARTGTFSTRRLAARARRLERPAP